MLRKFFSTTLGAACLLSVCTFPQSIVYAVESYDSAAALITEAVEVSVTNVESTTLPDALADLTSKISMSDDQVLYNGTPIGYWYSEESSVIYKTSAKSDTIFEKNDNGFIVDPEVLKLILTDLNNNLIENYVPTTDDWSKIVGKYDITMGDATIPAEQWITFSEVGDTFAGSKSRDRETINLTKLGGRYPSGYAKMDTALAFAWLIDDKGDLFIQNNMSYLSDHNTNVYQCNVTAGGFKEYGTIPNGYPYESNYNTLRVGLNYLNTTDEVSKAKLHTIYYVTDTTCTYDTVIYNEDILGYNAANLLRIDDPSIVNECSYEDAKAYGVAYFTINQIEGASTSDNAMWNVRKKMLDSYSCGKLVRGNTTLTKRLDKLGYLSSADVLEVCDSGWYVNDGTNIDSYMGTQYITLAGDTADIDAVADIEPLNFNVVVPTTLPIYVQADGTVSTANNAIVINKSNAAVKIRDVDIEGKPNNGWTLVEHKPSDVRDSNEFTFTTSLAADTVLDRGETLPFTYDADLSPMTIGSDALDLAVVHITVDWAD